jgi:hypothetical protein
MTNNISRNQTQKPRVNPNRINPPGRFQPASRNGHTTTSTPQPDRVEFSHELAGYEEDLGRCGTNFRCAQRIEEIYG